MEAVAVAPAGHEPPGELVDDDDLAVLDHVVDVELEEVVGLERRVDGVDQVHVGHVVEVGDAQDPLGLGDAGVLDGDGPALLVDGEMLVLLEAADEAVDPGEQLGRFVGRPGDDERRPGLVDEDAVDLVDDGVMELPLGQVGQAELHVVAEVVEAELVVGAVGDVRPVGGVALGVAEVVLDRADREAEEAVDGAHPLRVALGQVVVDRDDVDALAGEGVEVGRQGGDERFSLARLHLGDLALVEDGAADELDVEVAHPRRPPGGLADDGESLGEDVVQAGALGQLVLEFGGLSPELVVGQGLDAGFEAVDDADERRDPFEGAVVIGAEELAGNPLVHLSLFIRKGF